MATGDVYRLSLFTHTTQRQVINTHYYLVGNVTTTDQFAEGNGLGNAFIVNVLPDYRGALSTGVSFGCIKIEKVTGVEIPLFITFFTNSVGLRPGLPLPANIVAIIRRRGTGPSTPIRSLLSLTGISQTDTAGSFLDGAFVTGALDALEVALVSQIIASSTFQLAEYSPVIPNTPRVYARNVPVTVNVTTNTLTLTDGTNWSTRGFITAPGFRIAAPSKNKGTYDAIVTALSDTIALSGNELEIGGSDVISAQQATGPTDYFTLQSTTPQTALRQLNRRRSSHTGIVA